MSHFLKVFKPLPAICSCKIQKVFIFPNNFYLFFICIIKNNLLLLLKIKNYGKKTRSQTITKRGKNSSDNYKYQRKVYG